MEHNPDVVIVGAGVEGCSIGYALGTLGTTDITVFDRDTVGSGGTGKSAGIVRCHYGVPEIAALALASLDVFENAEELLGASAEFCQVGYLVGIGEDNLEPFRASLAAQRELGIRTDEIDRDAAAELWPEAHVDDFAAFAFEPRGGYADGYATAQAFAGAIRRAGGRIRQGTAVASIEVSGGRVTGVVLASGDRVSTSTVVVAAGAWSVPLLRPLGIDLPIAPQYVEEVMIVPGQDLGERPVFSDLVSKQYVHLRGHELLFGDSSGELHSVDDPDVYPAHASGAAVERVVEKALHRFPGFTDPSVSMTMTGVIDPTPDSNPVISATDVEGLYVAAGFSGHGFKIAPAVGRLAADLIIDGKSSDPLVPVEAFRLGRFAEGDLLLSRFPYTGAAKIR